MRFALPICPRGLLQGFIKHNLLHVAICDLHRTSDFCRKRRTLSKSGIPSYKYENYLAIVEKKEMVVIQLNFVRIDYTISY